MTTRRQFLQAGLFTAAAATLSRYSVFAAEKPAMTLGMQLWTLRKFDYLERIRLTKEAGYDEIEISGGISKQGEPGKRAVALNAEERKEMRNVLADNGVRAISLGGSPGTPEDFDFAKEFGLQFLQGEPPVDKLVEVSKRAAEYGIRFSLHNHAFDSRYWDYRETLKRVQDCSPALGICPDTGHFIRSGFDPVEVIRACKGRMVSIHLKDLNGVLHLKDVEEMEPAERKKLQGGFKDVAWGTGEGQVEAVLKELMSQGFNGPVILEYDTIYEDGNVADAKQCAEFFRKVVG